MRRTPPLVLVAKDKGRVRCRVRGVSMSDGSKSVRLSDAVAQRHYDALVVENKALKERVERLEKVPAPGSQCLRRSAPVRSPDAERDTGVYLRAAQLCAGALATTGYGCAQCVPVRVLVALALALVLVMVRVVPTDRAAYSTARCVSVSARSCSCGVRGCALRVHACQDTTRCTGEPRPAEERGGSFGQVCQSRGQDGQVFGPV